MLKTNRTLALVLLALSFVVMAVILFLSEGTSGGADSYVHFRIARFAWNHPHLFLDHWGKPVFTTIMALPALLGIKWAIAMNIIIGIVTGYLTFRIAQELHIRSAWLAGMIVIFTPIFFYELFSVMTEPLFGMFLVLAVFLIIRQKWLFAAIVISCFPLIRTEGALLIFYFAGYYILHKKWKYLPFLVTTIALYSLIGGIAKGDILWLLNEMPNQGAEDLYGSGSLLHYIKTAPQYLGWPILGLLLLGVLNYIRNLVVKKSVDYKLDFSLLILPFTIMFIAHSALWWKGMAGTMGLLRMMCTITPLLAIPAARGVDLFNVDWMRKSISIISLGAIIYFPFKIHHFPLKYMPEERNMTYAASFIEVNNLTNHRMFYFNPFICHLLGKDPFNGEDAVEHIPNKQHPGKGMRIGDLVVWDSHFGEHEGQVPFERLQNQRLKPLYNHHLLQINDELGSGFNHDVWVFIRQDHNTQMRNHEKLIASYIPDSSLNLGDSIAFSPACKAPVGRSLYNDDKIHIEASYQLPDSISYELAELVAVLKKQDNMVLYKSKALPTGNNTQIGSLVINMPDSTYSLDAYIWFQGEQGMRVNEVTINTLSYRY